MRVQSTQNWRRNNADKIGELAVQCLAQELSLAPKPGLVSFVDSGSHKDMDAETFLRSISSLHNYFPEITEAGMQARSFEDLKSIAKKAEIRMLTATGGVNTHRGAIFCLGLLCASAGICLQKYGFVEQQMLRKELLLNWGESLKNHARESVDSLHYIPGARQEAALGMPTLFEIGLKTLQEAIVKAIPLEQALIETLLTLMISLHDTNIISRGGNKALKFVQDRSNQFMKSGGTSQPNWQEQLWLMHEEFKDLNLSPGGAADLLSASLFSHRLEEMSW